MGIGVVDPLAVEPSHFFTGVQQIVCVVDVMTALQEHSAAVGLCNVLGSRFHICFGLDAHTGQHLRFRNIGSCQRGNGQQSFCQGLHRIGFHERRTAGGHHNRVDNYIFRPILAQTLCNGFNQRGVGDHADFYRVRTNIRENHVDLLPEKIGGYLHDPGYAGGVLRGQGGDRTHCVYAVQGHRFQICLNTGASAAITASD